MAVDVAQAERKILQEFGPKACIEEEPCRLHAVRSTRTTSAPGDYQPDWNDILKFDTKKCAPKRGDSLCMTVLNFTFLLTYLQELQGASLRHEAVVPAVGVHRRLHPGCAVLQAAVQAVGVRSEPEGIRAGLRRGKAVRLGVKQCEWIKLFSVNRLSSILYEKLPKES